MKHRRGTEIAEKRRSPNDAEIAENVEECGSPRGAEKIEGRRSRNDAENADEL